MKLPGVPANFLDLLDTGPVGGGAFMAPVLMLPSESVLGHTCVVLGPLRMYYAVSVYMHFILVAPSPCVRAAPHVTASGEAPRSGSGGSRSLGDLPNSRQKRKSKEADNRGNDECKVDDVGDAPLLAVAHSNTTNNASIIANSSAPTLQ